MMTAFARVGKRGLPPRLRRALIGAAFGILAPVFAAAQTGDWPQWGSDPNHRGEALVEAQPLTNPGRRRLRPFVGAEERSSAETCWCTTPFP
jgi:hypothetical protein